MKDNRLKGIIALVVVTVFAFGLIYGSRFFVRDGADGDTAGEIDVTGYEGIRAAREIHDDNGNVIGYAVTHFIRGFGGDIMMETIFEADAKTIQSLNIISHNETPGYGAVIEDNEYLSQYIGKLAPVFLEGTAPVAEVPAGNDQGENDVANGTVELQDGTYTSEMEFFAQSGFKDTVTITIENGAIAEVKWDSYNEAGEYKSVLVANDQYGMPNSGLNWWEQSEAIADFVIQNQSLDAIDVNEAGKTDSVTGVTISVNNFVNLVRENLNKAAGITPNTLQDGIYRVQDEGFIRRGFMNVLTLKVENGAITSLVWDSMNEQGEFKSYLSTAGKYTMVEGNPTWKQQADALAAYVIEKQSLNDLTINEEGHTDVVAGVSINIADFITQVEEALVLASLGQGEPVRDPESPVVGTPAAGTANSQIDAIAGATVTSKAVVEGVNRAYNFISEYVNR